MLKKSFKIDNTLYSEENIIQMIQDFSDFSLVYQNGILDISWETFAEIDEIFHEGMNYLIALYNENI